MADEVFRWGALGAETGAFLLRPRKGLSLPGVVALAGLSGVERRVDQFAMSGACMDRLSEWAEENEYRIAAQVHSHLDEAFLSPIDRVGGLRMEGFISGVVPNFAEPDPFSGSWGWWTFRDGDWRTRESRDVIDEEVTVLVFDEGGVVVRN